MKIEAQSNDIRAIQEQATASEKAAATERLTSQVTSALSGYKFQNKKGLELFQAHVSGAAKLQADGTVTVDGLSIDTFVEREIVDFAGLLDAPGSGRSGVQPRRSTGIDLDDITPQNMRDPKKANAVLAEIRKVGREIGYFKR